jgi:hypothetical protein
LKPQEKNIKEEKLLFQNYLIIFLDVLGQRKALREIKTIPKDESEKKIFIKKLKNTIGRVDFLRDAFKNYFKALSTITPDTSLVPQELADEFVSSQKSNAYFYGFSDSIIIAVPLMSDDENCVAMNGVYSALVATGGISLLAMAGKTALRGGLDVGVATQIQNNEIYGPALERAYYIESNIAEYPRYVLGNEFLEYLFWVENYKYKTLRGKIAKKQAKLCKDFIIQDSDGFFMIDFLGEKLKEVAGKSIDSKIVKLAYDFIVSQHKICVEKNDIKLIPRYYRLLKYFHSRAKLWNL